jgi:hypothetical protein
MRRNEETWCRRGKSRYPKDSKQTKQKKKNSFRFPFTRRLDDDRLSPLKFCLLKKKILSLSLSVVLSSSSSLCFKGEQQHKEMRREEEMTFSAKL